MNPFAIKTALSSVVACAICAFGLMQAPPAVSANTDIDAMPTTMVSTQSPVSTSTTTVTVSDVIENDGVQAPAGEQAIVDDTTPLASFESVVESTEQPAVDETQATITPEPAMVESQPAVIQPIAAQEAKQGVEMSIGGTYMIDGEKYFLTSIDVYDGVTYYTFEGEDVSGDGWSLGAAELIGSADYFATLNIVRI